MRCGPFCKNLSQLSPRTAPGCVGIVHVAYVIVAVIVNKIKHVPLLSPVCFHTVLFS